MIHVPYFMKREMQYYLKNTKTIITVQSLKIIFYMYGCLSIRILLDMKKSFFNQMLIDFAYGELKYCLIAIKPVADYNNSVKKIIEEAHRWRH